MPVAVGRRAFDVDAVSARWLFQDEGAFQAAEADELRIAPAGEQRAGDDVDVLAVLVEGGGYGAKTSAPIAANLLVKAKELGLLKADGAVTPAPAVAVPRTNRARAGRR